MQRFSVDETLREFKRISGAVEKLYNVALRNGIPCADMTKTVRNYKAGKPVAQYFLWNLEVVENERLRWAAIEHLHSDNPLDRIEKAIARCNEALKEWAEETLAKDPFYALKWGDDAVKTAAKRKLYLAVQAALKSWVWNKVTWGKLVAHLNRDTIRMAASPGHSTSPMSNYTSLKLTEAYASFTNGDDWVASEIRYWFEQYEELEKGANNG